MRTSVLCLASVALAVVACSPAPEASETPRAPSAPSDPIVIEASAETKEELGVATWGMTVSDGDSVINGYDDDGRSVTTIEQHVVSAADRSELEIVVKGSLGKASLFVTVTGDFAAASAAESDEDGVELEFLFEENTFTDNERASKVLERLRADANGDTARVAETVAAPTEIALGVRMGNAPGRGVPLTDENKKNICLNPTKQCAITVGTTALTIGGTAAACALVAKNVALIARCAAAGAVAGGVIGAAGAGLICTIVAGPKKTLSAGYGCVKGVPASI